MYCIPHILCILKTLIPTPPHARAPARLDRSRSKDLLTPRLTRNHVRFHRLLRHRGPRAGPRRRAPHRRRQDRPRLRPRAIHRHLGNPGGRASHRVRGRHVHPRRGRGTRDAPTRARFDSRREDTRDEFFLCVHPSRGSRIRRTVAEARANAFESLAGSIAIAIDIHPSSRESFRWTRVRLTRARGHKD